MRTTPEPDPLLDAVLAEIAPNDFREQLFQRTLQESHQRSRARVRNRVLAVVILAIIPALLLTLQSPAPPLTRAKPTVEVVTSTPLRPNQIVHTDTASVRSIATSPMTVAVVETGTPNDLFRVIDDQQLLALFADRAVALIRRSAHEAELLVFDSKAP